MKILVVEDDLAIAAAIRRGLVAEGFTVDVSSDGDDGWWKATELSYDLLILDLLLPGKNGFRICRELREAGDWTPILVLTAKDGDLDHTEALETGADAFLTKPFSFPVLVANVNALLRRGTAAAPGPMTTDGLVVDSRRRTCIRDDIDIDLTAREFSVLEYLIRHVGEVKTKAEILAGVWDYDFDGDPNIVEVYVGRLRRKIDEPFPTRLIETLRGAGYRLADRA